jgi:hypothetical protein
LEIFRSNALTVINTKNLKFHQEGKGKREDIIFPRTDIMGKKSLNLTEAPLYKFYTRQKAVLQLQHSGGGTPNCATLTKKQKKINAKPDLTYTAFCVKNALQFTYKHSNSKKFSGFYFTNVLKQGGSNEGEEKGRQDIKFREEKRGGV